MKHLDREAWLREQRQLAQRFLDEARGAEHHKLALEGLLMAYVSLARYHECCTEGAGTALFTHAYQLLDLVAARNQAQPPVSRHLH